MEEVPGPSSQIEGESEFQKLADFVPQLMWIANADGWIWWYNKRWYDYTGTTPEQMEGWGWRAVHDEDKLPQVMEGWTKSIATAQPFEMVFPLRGADGTFRPFLTRAQPLKNEAGLVERWFGTNTDIADQKQAEEHLQLLLSELNHRVKNTLTTVQGLVLQTFKTAPREEVEAFNQRLFALSRAHDLLMRGKWEPTELREIVLRSMAPLGEHGGRLSAEGPKVDIPANTAASWSMALHELSTNALKHGAFSNDVGTIEITWSLEGRRIRFMWRERGGPAVEKPARSGFGSRLIRTLGIELRGDVHLAFDPEGVVCTIEVPVDAGRR